MGKTHLEEITVFELICRMFTPDIVYGVLYKNEIYIYDWTAQDYMHDMTPVYLFDIIRKNHGEWLSEKVLTWD